MTTYANWVAKTASLLAEEHDLERGQRLRVDLPPHWLGPVFLGAAWTVGLVVVGPERPTRPTPSSAARTSLDRWAARADDLPVLACSLLPLGVRFADAAAAGRARRRRRGLVAARRLHRLRPAAAPTTRRPPARSATAPRPRLWRAAAAGSLLSDGGRLLSEANPASPPGLASFTEPLARGGSLVLVVHAEPERLAATYVAERATARFP